MRDDYKKRYEHKHEINEEEETVEYIYGRNAVLEALKAETTINKLMFQAGEQNGSLRVIIAMAREKGLVMHEITKDKLDDLANTKNHQGVMAYIATREYSSVDDILQIAKDRNEAPFVIVLDEIQDPNNLGAIIRTADAVGAHGLIIPKRRSAALTGAVAKASAGAIEHVAVARVSNIPSTIDELKDKGLWIAGTDLSGETAFYSADLKGAIALVIGSEGNGMGQLVRKKCDYVLTIPMKGKVSSLNASVAAGVVMYEIFKQR